MPRKRISEIFKKLSFENRLVFIGSAVLLVSVFMPWYEDLDAFHMGDMFLGITGPLYLVGFILLLISGFTLTVLISDSFEKKFGKLPLEEAHLNMLVGISSLFLLVLSASVYFHTKFGVNITMKEMRFGMMAAFVGAGMITAGGFLQNKKGSGFDNIEGKIEPLISLSREERMPQDINTPPEKVEEQSQIDKQIHL
jgi:hypothetical protein